MKVFLFAYRSLGVLSGLLILAGAFLITYSAFSRALVNGSSIWESELSVFLLMASIWVGCGPTMFANRHVSIKLLSKFGGRKLTLFLHVFSHCVCIIVGLVLTLKGTEVAIQAIQGNWHASTLWRPSLAVPYMIIPIGFGLFVIAAAIRLVEPVRNAEQADDFSM